MCLNYDIECQKYCMEHNNCYCSCLNDQIYCVNHYDYAWRLFSVLISALFCACCCYGCIMFFRRSNKNMNPIYQYVQNSNISPPSYNHIATENQQTQEKKYNDIKYNDIKTYPIDRS